MDILDENFGAQTAPVDLTELVGTELPPLALPKASIRNRAATAAMLTGDPSKAVENYQLLSREGEEGQSIAYDQLKNSILDNTKKMDMQGIMSVLADPKVSFDEKKKIVEGVKGSQFLSDSGTILHTNSLAAGSKGENPDQENARISAADSIREIYDARVKIQGLVNAHAASMDSVSVGTLGDMISLDILPGGTAGNALSVQQASKAITGERLSLWDMAKALVTPGHSKQEAYERLRNFPAGRREELTKSFLDEIGSHKGTLFGADSQFAQVRIAQEAFTSGGYEDTDKWIDTVSSLADVVGLGWAFRGAKAAKPLGAAGRAPKAERVFPAEWELVDDRVRKTGTEVSTRVRVPPEHLDTSDQIKRIEANSVVRTENPASPAKIIQQSNPEKARAVHEAVVNSNTDEVAEALYGTSKSDAIISDVFPQVLTESGVVTAKVVDIERNLRHALQVPEELIDLVRSGDTTPYTKAEMEQARAHVVNDFGSANGLIINTAMSSFTTDGSRINIGAVYGTSEGGFFKAEDAMEQASFALGMKGALPEELTLLKRQGLDYVPVKLEDVKGVEGDYLVRLNTFHDADPTDIASFDKFDVKRNLFDRAGLTVSEHKGSVSRYLLDAASMLHPGITGPAVVASDQTARFEKFMLNLASDFSDQFVKHPTGRQAKIDDYIREANFREIKMEQADLIVRGFQPDEISTLNAWKKYWDGQFYLENYDVVRTLNSQGYQQFKNTNINLVVKPIPKNQNLGRIYDSATDSIVIHGKGEGDMLYATGGTYAKLRRPAVINGNTVEHMVVYNTPTSYVRKFRDSDRVLNYRDGYFQIQYKAPKFVDELTRDSSGRITASKTIAVAGDTKEAEVFARRVASTSGKSVDDFSVRGDVRALRKDDDAWWDLNSASGRIAQRHRGKLLESASGPNHLGDGSYILNPVESAVRAAKSISGRTIARPMLEAAKARFINQYSEVIKPNGMGGYSWPKSVGEISQKGKETSKLVADARTTYEHINYLENGYINTLDDVFKTGMNAIANMLGSVHLSKLERGTMAVSEIAPTSLAKNGVFMAYIGSNVFRQWIVQPHQAARMMSYNPRGWFSGKIHVSSIDYVQHIMGLKKSYTKSEQVFIDFVQNSGMMDAVDKQNLIRGTLLEAADTTNKVVRAAKFVPTTLRKIGFDLGESANILLHAAAVYERWGRLGKDMSKMEVRNAAYSEIRAISYDMNFAGDMPYNQTSPAAALQFIQVPHKALMQMSNRRIDPGIRMRMAAVDMLMWGGPTALVAEMMGADILPDNGVMREAFLWGIESALLNHSLSTLSDSKVNIDFSSLGPYDSSGWAKLFKSVLTGDIGAIVANSPAGQLYAKEGGRASNAVAYMGRFFKGFVDEDEDAPKFLEVMNEVMKISSGWNNAVKAKLLLDARQRYDQYGSTIDQSVSAPEAWAQALGFGSADTRDMYRISQEMSKDVKKHKEDVTKVYEGVKRYYASKLELPDSDPVFVTKVTGRVLQIFKDDPVAQAIISSKLQQDLAGKDAALISLFLKRSGIPSIGGLRDQVKQMPISEEQKALMLQRIDDVENIRSEMKKE